MSGPSLFTPNKERGNPGARWKLWRHGPTEFSATKRGPRFEASVERDDCGLGCRCAAYLVPTTEEGARILAGARGVK